MLSDMEREAAAANFRRAASEFGFDFLENPQLEEGVSAFGYIPDYGSRNGTVICLAEPSDFRFDRAVLNWCEANDCFCSLLNAAILNGPYDRAYFRAMLRDWGRYEQRGCFESSLCSD